MITLLLFLGGAVALTAAFIYGYNWWQDTQVDRMVARVEAEYAEKEAKGSPPAVTPQGVETK